VSGGVSDKNPSGTIKVQIFIICLRKSAAVVCLEDGIQSQEISQILLIGQKNRLEGVATAL